MLVADKGLPRNFVGCLAVNSVIIVLTQVSIFGLLVIAVERYYAIRYPYDYCRHCTPRLTGAVVLLCWIAGFVVGLVPMFGWNRGESCTDGLARARIGANSRGAITFSKLGVQLLGLGYCISLQNKIRMVYPVSWTAVCYT